MVLNANPMGRLTMGKIVRLCNLLVLMDSSKVFYGKIYFIDNVRKSLWNSSMSQQAYKVYFILP